MRIKDWKLVPCALLALLGCDIEDAEAEARSAALADSGVPLAPTAVGDNKAISQSYCDHADRVLRAEFRTSQREADGELARDRERALLDALRAGEAVFAGAGRLVVRGVEEVHIGLEDGFLVAAEPGGDAPLARLRLARGARAHVLAQGVRKLVLTDSIGEADLAHLIVLTDLDGAVDVDVEGAPPCLVIDGGGDAAAGPLRVGGILDEFTTPLNPPKGVIHGTGGNDSITGGEGPDTIYGYAGADLILAMGGIDQPFGNEGDDTMYSGYTPYPYQEWMWGGKDNDSMLGESTTVGCNGDGGSDICIGCSWLDSCGPYGG